MDPTQPPLPQVSPAGGPNPNNAPMPWQMSILDLPAYGAKFAPDGGISGPWDRNAAVRAIQGGTPGAAPPSSPQMRSQQTWYQSSDGAGPGMNTPAIPLPEYDPRAPNLVQTPANGVGGQGTGAQNLVEGLQAQNTFGNRIDNLQENVGPGVLGAIHNWMFNKAGSPEAAAHDAASYAGQVYNRPETMQYFSAHPSLLAAAEHDPVNFAMKLGKILDAHVAGATGQVPAGTTTQQTPAGPVTRPDDNPQYTDAVAKAFGATPQQAHAATQGHHYGTVEERAAAMQGISRYALRNIWEMQHYLNPAQRAQAEYMNMIRQDSMQKTPPDAARAQYEANLRAIQFNNPYLPQQ